MFGINWSVLRVVLTAAPVSKDELLWVQIWLSWEDVGSLLSRVDVSFLPVK